MTGRRLALRIPPVIVCAVAIGLPYLYVRQPVSANAFDLIVASLLFISGGVIAMLAIVQFRTHQTTVDPRDPAKTSSLITTGVFRYSRNPIYLAMALLIVANGVVMNDWGTMILALMFCAYIEYFQIRPEEHALRQAFGDAYIKYSQRTRRWLGVKATDDAR